MSVKKSFLGRGSGNRYSRSAFLSLEFHHYGSIWKCQYEHSNANVLYTNVFDYFYDLMKKKHFRQDLSASLELSYN